MKTTLLLICTLLCLLYFSIRIVFTGMGIVIPPDEAWTQVVDPEAAAAYLKDQQSFNYVMGCILAIISGIGLVITIISLIFLRKQRILVWFRAVLLVLNISILLASCVLFFVTLVESTQPDPAFLQLCRPWLDSFWARAIQVTQQSAQFLGFCCGILSGVNCMAFYFFYRRLHTYGD